MTGTSKNEQQKETLIHREVEKTIRYVNASEHVLNQCQLKEQLDAINVLIEVLETQAKLLEGNKGSYYRQQCLMRQMLLTEIAGLYDKLSRIEEFNGTDKLGRPTVAVAHHGTTWSRARQIFERAQCKVPAPFYVSTNEWEWLGHGVYFWLMAPTRAAKWARNVYQLERRRSPWLPNLTDPSSSDFVPVPADDPKQRSHFAVVEVRLRLFWPFTLNLLDTRHTEVLQAFVEKFDARFEKRSIEDQARAKSNYGESSASEHRKSPPVTAEPQSDGFLRTRDCLFFNEFLAENPWVQCVLASFREGNLIGNGINIGMRDHVQINVLDQSIIDVSDITIKDAEGIF